MNDTASPRTSQVPSSPQSSNQQQPFSSKTRRRVVLESVHRLLVDSVQGLAAGRSGSSAARATATSAASAVRIARMRRCECVLDFAARVVAPQRLRESTPDVAAVVHWLVCSLAGCGRADADAAALLLRVSADRATRSVAFFCNSSSFAQRFDSESKCRSDSRASLKCWQCANAAPLTTRISSPASHASNCNATQLNREGSNS